jgi:hypothetical protein
MGLDVRNIPRLAGDNLPDRLRNAGFDVEVIRKPASQLPAGTITIVNCRRGEDVQFLIWGPDFDNPNEYQIQIANAWSWWPSVHKRRDRLQRDVTAIIEQSGGHRPWT